eukprot:1025294-Rhodomonas_salina.1
MQDKKKEMLHLIEAQSNRLKVLETLQQKYNELVQKYEQRERNAAAQAARGNERQLRSSDN